MIVDVSDIISNENKELSKEVEIEFASFDSRIGEFPVLEKHPFALTFANVENKRLRIEGQTEVTIGIPCDRCLTELPRVFSIDVLKEIDLEGLTVEDKQEQDDTNYTIGKNLDVDKLIFGEILVSWPMKVLCSEDCKGICKRCGANLNHATCQCQKTEPDPRMAAIQDIFNQFKEV